MKIIHINMAGSIGSTGKIIDMIAAEANKKHHKSWVAYPDNGTEKKNENDDGGFAGMRNFFQIQIQLFDKEFPHLIPKGFLQQIDHRASQQHADHAA